MILKIIIINLLMAFALAICMPKPCPDFPKLYRELGCTPQYTNNYRCPNSFVCPDFTSFNQSQCHYKGISYNPGESLKRDGDGLCQGDCICSMDSSRNKTNFECPFFDCVIRTSEHCVRQNELNQCCPSSHFVCGDAIKKLPKCTFQGKTYLKGDIMSPRNGCYNCICNEHFNNATDYQYNQNCKLITCGMEIYYMDKLEAGCAPIFSEGANSCCPHGYRCPAANDYIVPGLRGSGNTKSVCKFGKLILHQSDQLNGDQCTVCSCTDPPMVQCINKSNCS